MMNYFLNIAGVLILIAGLAAGFVGHFGVMSFAFFAFIGCLITANLDRISEFRASALYSVQIGHPIRSKAAG